MTKSAKRNIIISAILAIIMCACLVTGATFALFTSESSVNIAVTSGKVNVVATVDEETLALSHQEYNSEKTAYETIDGSLWGGTAVLNEKKQTLTINKMVPMDKISFTIKVENKSNVAVKYRTIIMCEEDDGLFEGLTVTIAEGEGTATTYEGRTTISKYAALAAGSDPASVKVTVEMTEDKGDEYQETSCTLLYKVEAIQGNAKTTDAEANVLEIYNATDLKWFQKHAADISGTVKLMNDIDLGGAEWTPMNPDSITFDGNQKTISNFTATGTYTVGLFGSAESCTIKNLTVTGATVKGINQAGAIVGCGVCTTITGCTVTNSTITTKNVDDNGDKAGAIIGYLSAEMSASVTNCTASNCTVKGYRDVGGLIGMANGTQKIAPATEGWTVTGNTVKDITVINDRTIQSRVIAEGAYNVGEVIGRIDCENKTIDSSNKVENVSIFIQNIDGWAENTENSGKTDAEKIYGISNVNGLKYFQKNASAINGTVKLLSDVDLGGEEWTPLDWYAAGGRTFDGNNKTVSNFVVNVTGIEMGYAGFFSKVRFVKNLTVANANITGTTMVGGIVGCGEVSEITNCHVKDSVITAVVWWDSGTGSWKKANNVGGIVGYLCSSDADACVTDCSVVDCTIKGYRDLGGLIGTSNRYNGNVTVTGNKVENITIISDRTADYKKFEEETKYNLGKIIGVVETGSGTGIETIKDNDATNVKFETVTA